jgi:hypothetical protein
LESIRSGRGLGDSLYLQSVVRVLLSQGRELTVSSDYPEVFRHLPVKVIPFTRNNIDLIAHYTDRKGFKETKQFNDACLRVGIKTKEEIKLDWKVQKPEKYEDIISAAGNRPIALVMSPRNPMARDDGFGSELLPRQKDYQRLIDSYPNCFKIQIGRGKLTYKLTNIDLDLVDKTSIEELIDLAYLCSGGLGFCSFIIPLMESFKKPSVIMWTEKTLKSSTSFINTITPTKILYNDNSHFIMDKDISDGVKGLQDVFLY